MVQRQSPSAAFPGEHVEERVGSDGPLPAPVDIPPAMGYKHRERLNDDFFRGEEGSPECGSADSPEEVAWMHGMHAVMGFLRSRPFGPSSSKFDRDSIEVRRGRFVRRRRFPLRRGRPGGSLLVLSSSPSLYGSPRFPHPLFVPFGQIRMQTDTNMPYGGGSP